jgi:hypothetical protein
MAARHWTPEEDAALQTAAALGHTFALTRQAVEAVRGLPLTRHALAARRADLGLAPGPLGRPRKTAAGPAPLQVTLGLAELTALAERAWAAEVTPDALAASIIRDALAAAEVTP